MKPRWIATAGIIVIVFAAVTAVLWPRPRHPASVPAFNDPSCRATYLDLYERSSIDIRIVFGYKDTRPARFVADRYEKALFVQSLVAPCRPGNFACGFQHAQTDADLYRKSLTGPDGKEKMVSVRVIQSSAGPDDDENRRDPFQSWQSEYANERFLSGLSEADVVFYNGHSRTGGGPDFAAPKLTPGRHVDYGWYQKHRPGLNDMVKALHGRVKLAGVFSCASNQLFAGRLLETKPGLGLISSRQLLYFSDALEASLQALSALLEMRCQPEFTEALKTPGNRAGSKLVGFFRR